MRTLKLTNEIMRRGFGIPIKSEIMILREAERIAKIEAVKAARERAAHAKAAAIQKRTAAVSEKVSAVKAMKLISVPRSTRKAIIKHTTTQPPIILSRLETPVITLSQVPQPPITPPQLETIVTPLSQPQLDTPKITQTLVTPDPESKHARLDKIKAARAAKLRSVLNIGKCVEELRLAEAITDMRVCTSSPREEPICGLRPQISANAVEPQALELTDAVTMVRVQEDCNVAVVVAQIQEVQVYLHAQITEFRLFQPSATFTKRVAPLDETLDEIMDIDKGRIESTSPPVDLNMSWLVHYTRSCMCKRPTWMWQCLLRFRRSRQPKLKLEYLLRHCL